MARRPGRERCPKGFQRSPDGIAAKAENGATGPGRTRLQRSRPALTKAQKFRYTDDSGRRDARSSRRSTSARGELNRRGTVGGRGYYEDGDFDADPVGRVAMRLVGAEMESDCVRGRGRRSRKRRKRRGSGMDVVVVV